MKADLVLLVLFGLLCTIVAVPYHNSESDQSPDEIFIGDYPSGRSKREDSRNLTTNGTEQTPDEDEYYDDEEEATEAPILKPLKNVTCTKTWSSWLPLTSACFRKCAKQGGTPNCCEFDGPLYKCQCLRAPVVGGGGLRDLISPSKLFSTFTENVSCGFSSLKSFGKALVSDSTESEQSSGKKEVKE